MVEIELVYFTQTAIPARLPGIRKETENRRFKMRLQSPERGARQNTNTKSHAQFCCYTTVVLFLQICSFLGAVFPVRCSSKPFYHLRSRLFLDPQNLASIVVGLSLVVVSPRLRL